MPNHAPIGIKKRCLHNSDHFNIPYAHISLHFYNEQDVVMKLLQLFSMPNLSGG